jgi:hypothetical protein
VISQRLKRGLGVGAAAAFIGLTLSAYLAIIGYTTWESVRYGRANTFLYGLEQTLTLPARLAGVGFDGVPARVASNLLSALFWGAVAGALKRRSFEP